MPMRPSHDRPVNDPLSRMGYVRHRSVDGDFERIVISYPGYGLQPGETPEPARLGARSRSQWLQESGLWRMRAPAVAGYANELLIDGRDTDGNPPTKGWPISASGFGIQFADAMEPSIPGNGTTLAARVAWHPSGRAVLIAPISVFAPAGEIEIWEWIPGTGFGKKYVISRLDEADQDLQALYNNINGADASSFEYPRVDNSGGQYAFSPDGNYLAWAGKAGTTHENDPMPLVVVPFNLQNGLDMRHPQYPSGDQGDMGDANCVAWSPDGRHIAIGTDSGDWVRAWNWNAGFGAAEAAPASPPINEVFSIAFHPTGNFLAVGYLGDDGTSNPMAWAWTPGVGWGAVIAAPADPLPATAEAQGISWHPDGNYLLVAENGTPAVWAYEFDPSGGGSWGDRLTVVNPAPEPDVSGGSFSPDGKFVAVIYEVGPFGDFKVRVDLWSFASGVSTLIDTVQIETDNPPYIGASVAWRPS